MVYLNNLTGCSTYLLADLILSSVQSVYRGEPPGIYDARTELFSMGAGQSSL